MYQYILVTNIIYLLLKIIAYFNERVRNFPIRSTMGCHGERTEHGNGREPSSILPHSTILG